MNQDSKTLLYSYGLPITLFLHLCVSITLYIYIYIVFGQLVKQITLITLQKTLVKTQKYAIKSRRNVEIINLKYLSVKNCKNGVKEFNLC